MRKQDVEVGGHYAYAPNNWGVSREVEVVDFKGTMQTGYGFKRRTVNGITIRFVGGAKDGQTVVVTGRSLRRTWAEEVVLRKEAEDRAEARARDERETAARRAAKAMVIEKILWGHGVGLVERYVYTQASRDALVAVGYKALEDPDLGHRDHFMSRFDLATFMSRGTVDEEVLTTLLYHSGPTA